ALRKLSYALRNLSVQGVQTNRDFLIRLLEHPVFREGKSHTGFIHEHLPELIAQEDKAYDLTAAAVVALFIQKMLQTENQTLPNIPLNYRNNPYRDPSVKLQIGTEIYEVAFRLTGSDTYRVACRGWQAEARIVDFHTETIRLSLGGVQRQFRVIRAGDRYFVHSLTGSRTVTRLPRHPAPLAASEQGTANATMPGQVIKILVAPGQQVTVGDALVILEAMKMEQTIRAATDGVVESILVKTGDVVGPGEPLVHISAAQHTKESGGNF
ncbi:MAG TPA: biotin/lipoyl-containing protein, partial [Blastocatellia bacterium]|nr:biotin/lipoyl-containing protein [Blastocatellia bacterium]